MGKGGKQASAPSRQTVEQTNIPEYARPYVERMLGKTEALTDINQNPYQPYGGQRIADFNSTQRGAFENAMNQTPASQLGTATDLSTQAGYGGLAAANQSRGLQNQALEFGAGGAEYGALGAQYGNRGAIAAEQGFNAGERFAQQATNPGATQAYMSPYMQNVVDYQKSQATRDFQKQGVERNAQAVARGAFGGSRQAIVDAEAQRNLNTQLQGIQATGTQKAFEDAQRQQQFGANLGIQGLQAGYQGTAQGIQGAQAGMQGAQTGLQGVQGAIGAGQYGLQGLGQAGQAAGQLGQIGQTQFSQEQNINAERQKIGAIQQGQAQQGLDVAYQDFLKQRNYPYQQMAFQSDMLRGLPLSQSSGQMYNAPPNTASQLGGLGMSALGVYGMSGGFKGANGGIVGYARGGKIGYSTGGDITMMSTEQLTKLLDNPSLTPLEVDSVEKELMMRQRMESNPQAGEIMSGIAAIPTGQMVPEEGMAGGGIVAFANGDLVSETGLNILPTDVKNSTTPENARAYEDFLLADIMRRQKKMEEGDPFAASKAREEKIEAQLAKSQESAPYRALTLAGLRTMGGQSQYGLTNLAGGAEAGLGAYEASRKEVDDANKLLLGQAGEREKSQFARESALLGSQQTTLGALQSRREAGERLATEAKEKNRIAEEKYKADNETRIRNNASDNATRQMLIALRTPSGDKLSEAALGKAQLLISGDSQIKSFQKSKNDLIKLGYAMDSPDIVYLDDVINERQNQILQFLKIESPPITASKVVKPPAPPPKTSFLDNLFSSNKPAPAKPGTVKFDKQGNIIKD